MTGKILVAPSLLGADLTKVREEAQAVETAGADWLHVDVMDGRFVPPISFGEVMVSALKRVTSLPLDTHLMITEPERHVESFIKAGSDGVTFHVEASPDPSALLSEIRAHRVRSGLSVNPETAVESVFPFLAACDLVLIMSVHPGWGGQGFIDESLLKITRLREEIDRRQLDVLIQVDGGINADTAPLCIEAGADCLVAGTFVFKSPERSVAIASLRGVPCE